MPHTQYSMHDGHNDSIKCSVTECKYHGKGLNFCTLEQINVTKNAETADTVECTDCGSFMKD